MNSKTMPPARERFSTYINSKASGRIFNINLMLTIYISSAKNHLEFVKFTIYRPNNLVYLKDVIAVHEERGKLLGRNHSNEVAVHYITYPKERILRRNSVTFQVSKSVCEHFMKAIIDHTADKCRPKRLLVLINPASGRKKGVKIFRDKMAPLFRLCQIETDVIVVTQRINAETVLQSYNLNSIDGIVTVGGDGLCCDCVNGLLRRFQKDQEIDFNNSQNALQQPSLPIGLIPAGSGNLLVKFLHGTKDLETALLKIISGKTVTTNVAGVYANGKLVIYSALILGFGLCGRMVRDCEKTRWLGPSKI
ncbi:hypothetical protein KUTeg_016999 [Tegillarca granosa]|uniref:DAGKc domain-containing protein n=1 Tax=Tegillarca granosa TaxID=220873 RepID=A0ABQ9EMG5_TEGGR|nr:hypothetical protein KUTeg_016999 [Tegillarca granosa]